VEGKKQGKSLQQIRKEIEDDTNIQDTQKGGVLGTLNRVGSLVEGINKTAVLEPVQLESDGSIANGNHSILASYLTDKTHIPVIQPSASAMEQLPVPTVEQTTTQTSERDVIKPLPIEQTSDLDSMIRKVLRRVPVTSKLQATNAAREAFKGQEGVPDLEQRIEAFLKERFMSK
jgi:hypothetical protein